MLYPVENAIREIKDLSGVWSFKVDTRSEGYRHSWFASRLNDAMEMPVPASYNDITTDRAIRDHIGDVWYERDFIIPHSWAGKRIVLRVGSATHHATVWVNGREAVRHKGGFLPFEADITSYISVGESNRVTLAVNNELDWSCLPSGEIFRYDDARHPKGFATQETFFDFYNYAGLHRPVKLYTTPTDYIADLHVTTDIHGQNGSIWYDVVTHGSPYGVRVKLYDADNTLVAEQNGNCGVLTLPNARFWEPGDGYLYNLIAEITDASGQEVDQYALPVGIRTVEVCGKQFLINGKPFYFRGFGKHEDVDIRGKGLDEALNVRDFHLLRWIGANSFRTSHYPYAEEIMRMADRAGLVVIDEVPAVGMCFWSDTNTVFRGDRVNDATLQHHLQTIREMIARDKNHPCVVMWSVANEAATNEPASLPYFTEVINTTRALDPTRPVTMVQTMGAETDKVSHLLDIICLNRYCGWYTDHGQLSVIEMQLDLELDAWFRKYAKPMIMSEYGADTIAGFHQTPSVTFSEDFQREYLAICHNAFDHHDFVIGEHVWAFADFATKQGLNRVGGNKKGIFTRQRQPKSAAYDLKARWTGPHPKWNRNP
jgi:beta-glucuronidase